MTLKERYSDILNRKNGYGYMHICIRSIHDFGEIE